MVALSEFVGTALLVGIGCSWVVLDFAPGSPVVHAITSAGVRRAVTGMLFGTTGGLIALSWVGKISGAHINPVVTLAFWLQKKMTGPLALIYMLSQLAGAVAGAWPLSLWGVWAAATHDAVTVPGPAGDLAAVLGEAAATFCLIVALFFFLGHPRIRRFTPAVFPVLYALLVYVEAPFSGTSTNPARSLGPAVIARIWTGWWIYWLGPAAGTLMAVIFLGWLLPIIRWEVGMAKLYHFHHDPFHLFDNAGGGSQGKDDSLGTRPHAADR